LKSMFFRITLLALALSCKSEEVQKFDELTPDEQAAIRTRGTALCLAANTPIYARFKTNSNGMFVSSTFQRGDGFEFLFKNGATTERTVEIKVWKQTATEVFFYITDDQAAGDYFLRIQKTDNETMIDDLLAAHCTRPTLYTSTTGDNGPLTMVNDYEIPRAPNNEIFKDTYTMSFDFPAFFANYRIGRTKRVEDADENQVGSTVTYTSTLTAKAYTFTSDNAEDSAEYNQKFCVINRGSAYRFARERNVEGFKIDFSNLTDCPTTKPVTWNLTI